LALFSVRQSIWSALNAHRQALGPVILDALVHDEIRRRELPDPVGAGAERRLERRLGDVARLAVPVLACPPVLGQHHQLADDLRQLAIARAVEREGDLALARLLRLDDVLVVRRRERVIRLERIEREDHVVGRHRPAVVPLRFRAQPVGHRREIVRVARGVGEQAVLGRYLVHRGNEQRLEHALDAQRDQALEAHHHRVEIVERADAEPAHGAALGRIRVDVVEPFEVCRIFQIAEQREAVPPRVLGGLRRGGAHEAGQSQPAEQRGGEGERAALEDEASGQGQGVAPQSHWVTGSGPGAAKSRPMSLTHCVGFAMQAAAARD
jgi:hypothetical protein